MRIPFFSREARFQSGGRPATWTGAYVMGLAFAFGWTPCIGPILGAILGVAAASDTVGQGRRCCRSIRWGCPALLAGGRLFGAFLAFLTRFRRHLGLVEKALGRCSC